MTLDQTDTAPAMDVLDAIRRRRSAVRYGEGPIARAVVEQIIEAARWAPNHHLTEPWRFVVLTGDARAAIGEAIAAELLQNTANTKAEAEAAGVRTKVMRSPVIIAVGQVRTSPDPEKDLEDYAACACATQNLLLAAHAAGLAAKWSTGKMTVSPAAKQFLGLDP
ncbi:MAG: nitroreductase family protein, partial [Dehalococcoidia bacterium]